MGTKATKRIIEIKNEIQQLQFEQDEILDIYLGQDKGQWHKIGTWECGKSPVGFCVYQFVTDTAWDDCVYCHEPNKRK